MKLLRGFSLGASKAFGASKDPSLKPLRSFSS